MKNNYFLRFQPKDDDLGVRPPENQPEKRPRGGEEVRGEQIEVTRKFRINGSRSFSMVLER